MQRPLSAASLLPVLPATRGSGSRSSLGLRQEFYRGLALWDSHMLPGFGIQVVPAFTLRWGLIVSGPPG